MIGYRVGAEYCVTSCDLGVFVDEAAEPIPPENARIRDGCGWVRTPGGRVLVQRPVRPVAVVVIDVLAEAVGLDYSIWPGWWHLPG